VSCESCHGPGDAHVLWAKDPQAYAKQVWKGTGDKGLTTAFPQDNGKKEIELCAACHSRRGPLGGDSPPPGSRFADHYRLALLRDGLYHADGQIDDEVYVYGSFLQSKMYARGVRCTNCHEPHSGRLVTEGNAVCTQCHSRGANAGFPSLKKKVYDDPSHHHHEMGSQGAQCVNCHMPSKTYMQVDPRRDHSFRVPRPDLSVKLATPNACTSCHQSETAEWAAIKVKEWFPNGRTGTHHYGEILHAGRSGETPEAIAKLIDFALDGKQPAIARATALDLLRRSTTPDLHQRITPLLKNKSHLIRLAALRMMDRVPAALRISHTVPLLDDPVKVVRLEAARLLIGVSLDRLSKRDQAKARQAITAYQRSLFARSDFPETQMQIAGLAMYLRKFATAEKALRTALSMDPQLADAWFTLARIQLTSQKANEARKTLEQAALKMPNNGLVFLQLGSLYTDMRDHDGAIAALEKSLQLSGSSPTLLELLATNHMVIGNIARARTYADRLMSEYPGHIAGPLVRQLLQLPTND